MTATAPGLEQRAAWLAYTAVAKELLPLLEHEDRDRHAAVGAGLDGVAAHIRRYASLWPDQGQMLTAAMDSALRLHLNDDRIGLVALLRLVAARLFYLSAARRPPHHVGRPNERPWNRRFTL